MIEITMKEKFDVEFRACGRAGLQGGVLTMNAPEVKDWSKVGRIPAGNSAEMARREAIRQDLQARLMACPFCGHEPMLRLKNWPGERSAITCQCGACMAFDGKTEFYLIEKWNARRAA